MSYRPAQAAQTELKVIKHRLEVVRGLWTRAALETADNINVPAYASPVITRSCARPEMIPFHMILCLKDPTCHKNLIMR